LKRDVMAVAVASVSMSLRPWADWRGLLQCPFDGREFGFHVVNAATLHFHLVLLPPDLDLLPFDDAPLFFEFLANRVPIRLNHSASSRKAPYRS